MNWIPIAQYRSLFGLLEKRYKKFRLFEIRKILLTASVAGIGWGFLPEPPFLIVLWNFSYNRKKNDGKLQTNRYLKITSVSVDLLTFYGQSKWCAVCKRCIYFTHSCLSYIVILNFVSPNLPRNETTFIITLFIYAKFSEEMSHLKLLNWTFICFDIFLLVIRTVDTGAMHPSQ